MRRWTKIKQILLAALAVAVAMGAPIRASANTGTFTYQQEINTAKSLMMVKPDQAYGHAENALILLKPLRGRRNAFKDIATATWLSGEALTQIRKPASALLLLNQALYEVRRTPSPGLLLADVLLSRGRAEAALGMVQSALSDFQGSFAAFGRSNDKRGQAKSLQEIGSLYLQAHDYSRALTYYDQARPYAENSLPLTMSAENNSGAALKGLGDYRQAEAAYSQALSNARQLKNYHVVAHILANIAVTELLQNRPMEARTSALRGLALNALEPENGSERPFLLAVEANTFSSVGDYVTAGRLLNEAFTGVALKDTTPAWRDAHELAAQVFEHLRKPEAALAHFKAFKRLDDEDTALAASTEAALMGAKFDFASQATKIAQLQAENLRHEANLAKAQTRSIVVQTTIFLVAGLLIIGLLVQVLISMRKSRIKITAMHDALATSNQALEKALNARTEFLAMTSHEIRTPLNGILGMTQVMLAEPAVTGDLRDRLEIIKTSGVSMNEMLSDLLDIAKIEKGQFVIRRSEIDLLPFVTETTRMWSDKARVNNIAFEVDHANCPRHVLQDSSAIRQILNNLLSNAVKFTHQGSVRLAIGTIGDAPIERLVFTITDTGIGIPPGDFSSVFDAFSQVDGGTSRHYGGTGLGLAITKNLVELLGGEITLTSTLGVGTTFRVELPLVRPESSAATADYSEHANVMVLEDNRLSQAMFRSVLKDRVKSLSFITAIENVAADVSMAGDVLVVDGAFVKRQNVKDPLETVKEFCNILPAMPIILLWPSLSADETNYFRSIGVSQALAKPVTGDMLFAAIDQAWSAKGPLPVERNGAASHSSLQFGESAA